jgi:hypothetical protein
MYYLLLETLQRNNKQSDEPINTTLLQLIKTRQAIYEQRNTEERSCYHGVSGKAMSITYSECLCVEHAMHMRHIVICGLQYNTFHTLSQKRHDFRKKKNYLAQNVCFENLYNVCLKYFSF